MVQYHRASMRYLFAFTQECDMNGNYRPCEKNESKEKMRESQRKNESKRRIKYRVLFIQGHLLLFHQFESAERF